MLAAPLNREEFRRKVLLDLLRQLEGIKKKLKELLDT
jgi:hypothetical protein